jgi:hypothetical protein
MAVRAPDGKKLYNGEDMIRLSQEKTEMIRKKI